ncbi:MAG: LEPR-XLL domain-containing protein, partial [Chitinophagaceae bacterium]|nr:LEPR-XLL domain-containing protein [Rubrivivax sp.]
MTFWKRGLRRARLLASTALPHGPGEDFGDDSLFTVEPMEPRLLLSADLTPGAEKSILDGLQGVADVLGNATALQAFKAPIPYINRSLGEVVDLGSLARGLRNATATHFAAPGVTDVEALATALRALPDLVASATVTTAGTVDTLSLVLSRALAPTAYAFDLTGAVPGQELRIEGTATVRVQAERGLTLSIGIDHASESFFVSSAALSVNASSPQTAIATGLDWGIVDGSVAGGRASFAATLTGALQDPDNTDGLGRITTTELTLAPVGTLVTANTTGTAQVTLPFTADVALGIAGTQTAQI